MFNPESTARILAITLVLLPPLAALFDRWFLPSNPGAVGKLINYAITVAVSWMLTVAAVSTFGIQRLNDAFWPWAVWLPFPAIFVPLIGIFLARYFGRVLKPLFQSLRGERWRRAYAMAYRRHTEFAALLPETAVERFGFVLVSLTAGVCEESLYRGFLIRFLHESVPAPLIVALIASSLAFGLGHIYQGWRAALRISRAGMAFGLLFLLSGSLIPGIVLHVLMDLQGVYILRPFPNEDAAPAMA